MRCIAHILNLVVIDGLKDVNESIKKVRECVRYIRNSPQRLKKFMEFAKLLGIESRKSLCLDVPTRWNNTYLMLEAAIVYERVFEKYDEEESCFMNDLNDNIPDSYDWVKLKKFCQCLGHFYMLTMRISGSLYVTSNMHFPEICDLNEILHEMTQSEDFELKTMGHNMRSKFEKYWGDPEKMNKLIFFASVFYPTCKFEYMEFSLNSMFGSDKGVALFQAIRIELNLMYDEYKVLYDPYSACNALSSFDSQSFSTQSASETIRKPLSLVKAKFKKHRMEMGNSSGKKSELEVYLTEAILEEDNVNVLKWWKLNSIRFPILSKMARDILAIPISTVASESAFSTGGRVLDCFRSSLTHKLVEALICTQDWFRASEKPLIVEESLSELEVFEEGHKLFN